MNSDTDRLRGERDLYRSLLSLNPSGAIEPVLTEALAAIVAVTRARHGYLEIAATGSTAEPWVAARGMSEERVIEVKRGISRGIVAKALEGGRTVRVASALLDPRFSERPSVRAAQIASVVCAPIEGPDAAGFLFLEGFDEAASDGEQEVHLAELFARQAGPFVGRLMAKASEPLSDPTQPFRARLELDAMVGRSPELARVFQLVEMIAPLDVPVLLTGETGTGKTLAARAIHDNGPRRDGPFVALNCATVPESLAENELFGSERGAHSTADRSRDGKIDTARGGTLLLDEVGELPLAVQAKLLSLLQSGTYYRLGGTRELRAEARIVAATNVDLEEAMRLGRFREDLYYRLSVLPIEMPPLRERREDLPGLAERLVADIAARHGTDPRPLSPAASLALGTRHWPGNVRQLANTLERGMIRAAAAGSAMLEAEHLFGRPDRPEGDDASDGLTGGWQEQTRRFHRELLVRTLRQTGGNVSEAARRLDVSRTHLHELLKRHGIER